MKKKKRGIDKRIQKIFGIVCLSFLLGTAGGALAANLLSVGEQASLSAFLQDALENGRETTFLSIFWKYFKYDFMIWMGGWMSFGLFFSGAAFLFRSISVGFTSAVMMTTYGARGVFMTLTNCLPQNLLLIPTYIFIMSAAAYYLLSWQEAGGKRALKRERRRKQTEYCILFAFSVILLAAASGVEWGLLLI